MFGANNKLLKYDGFSWLTAYTYTGYYSYYAYYFRELHKDSDGNIYLGGIATEADPMGSLSNLIIKYNGTNFNEIIRNGSTSWGGIMGFYGHN